MVKLTSPQIMLLMLCLLLKWRERTCYVVIYNLKNILGYSDQSKHDPRESKPNRNNAQHRSKWKSKPNIGQNEFIPTQTQSQRKIQP